MRCTSLSLIVCYLFLVGCSITAGQVVGSDRPAMHRLALPMYHHIIARDKERCINGGFVGDDINELFHTDREWGTATNAKEDGGGKRYTFIYYNADDKVYSKEWYEHWYQLYDYDLDGKIDDCKYYKVFKGTRNTPYKGYDEFVKKFKKESADYKKRHNLKF